MIVWTLLEWLAWGASGLILAWMVADALRVSHDYDEDVLLSSREGEMIMDEPHDAA
ncbi:MAG: hypothetical protein KDG89_02670 [Geminicoccaceae bacterium]|nr:hypothetical protein [Geminicoccaceae bacterium]